MKKLIFISTVSSILFSTSCKQKDWFGHSVVDTVFLRDTIYLTLNDTNTTQKKIINEYYPNFTKTRNVSFTIVRNWEDKTYTVGWQLWIDGEIAYSNPEIFSKVKPQDLEYFKSNARKTANDKIPSLLKVWSIK